MNVTRNVILPAFMLSLMIFSAQVRAACTADNGWNNRVIDYFLPDKFTVQADIPVGSVIYNSDFYIQDNGERFASCSGTYTAGTKYVNGMRPGGDGIASTNIPGIGIRIYFNGPGTEQLVPRDPTATWTETSGIFWGNAYTFKGNWRVQLIKTGDVSGGTLKKGHYVAFGIGGVLITTMNIAGGGTVVPVGCTVSTPDITVPMGSYKKQSFGGVGSSSAWQDFNIDISCNKDARINVRIDASADTTTASQGVMQLDKSSGDIAATGVGIQLGYRPDNSLVEFGREKYYWTSASGGNEIIQLRARYYQTQQKITAGQANGTATLTLNYR